MNIPGFDFNHPDMGWAVAIRDARSGELLFDHDGGRTLNTASIGKLILLAFAGNELLCDPDCAAIRLDRRRTVPVADSGIWQHLDTDELPLGDVLKLVFLASDNLATNALLDYFGLENIRAFRSSLGFVHTDLFDFVRDQRPEDGPQTLSSACAGELCNFMAGIVQGCILSRELSDWLRQGLSLGMDLSMVPTSFGLDPLARPGAEHATPAVANKTGTDIGIRADTGLVAAGPTTIAYAAICNYDEERVAPAEVLAGMHAIGRALRIPVTEAASSYP